MGFFDFLKDKSPSKKANDNSSLQQKMRIAMETDRLNNLGVMAYRNGNIQEAIEYYTRALEIMPTNDDSLINLGVCYNKLGEHSKAITYCKKAIEIAPNRPEGYRTIGDAYYKASNFQEVARWYKESARRGDKSTRQWLENNGYL